MVTDFLFGHKVLVQVLVARIESGMICHTLPKMLPQDFHRPASGIVMVEVTDYLLLVLQGRDCLVHIGYGVQHKAVLLIPDAQSQRRKPIHKALVEVAATASLSK